ncbi:MAG: tRNA (N6-isopentenyl adenosine(37)-C2)-methylthiotransferase MiaB [Pirellulaceae bacterium]|nr:tRNA (N6-isopentenyl adenosine(37)-C2)-methylthiotransferase MiaB [Pirellulaceae bacterium]
MSNVTQDPPAVKHLYIDTVGCQMNVLDSEMVVASLRKHGYRLTQDPGLADTILFNTCSVREHAEEKSYNNLFHLKQLKLKHPDKIIGVIGCMAQKDQKAIFDRVPFVDLVVGPGQLHQIPSLLEKVADGQGQQLAVSMNRRDGTQEEIRRSHETFDPLRDPEMRPTPYQAYIRIQIGCDKFCTYCIVPMTRGPEQGRLPSQILTEARLLADQGCKEITLLGQTVNSYRFTEDTRTWRLADLLVDLNAIDGIERIKFVTNYPKDMTRELLEAIRDLPKCSPYLHVPAQSGSDTVLKRMKRGYTTADYYAMMDRIHEILPNAAIASDFIVGFCGETDEEFQDTITLVERCRFKNSFIFQYSVRAGTKGAELLEDDIPEEVKKRRNHELLEVQNRICLEDNLPFLGRSVEVLVEGPSKLSLRQKEEGPIVQMTGRTSCDRIVVWQGNTRQAGEILQVTIDDVTGFTLFGTVDTFETTPELIPLTIAKSK